jgi:hypothetical protein
MHPHPNPLPHAGEGVAGQGIVGEEIAGEEIAGEEIAGEEIAGEGMARATIHPRARSRVRGLG